MVCFISFLFYFAIRNFVISFDIYDYRTCWFWFVSPQIRWPTIRVTNRWRIFYFRRDSSKRFIWKDHRMRNKTRSDLRIFMDRFTSTRIPLSLEHQTVLHTVFVSMESVVSITIKLQWILWNSFSMSPVIDIEISNKFNLFYICMYASRCCLLSSSTELCSLIDSPFSFTLE